MNKNGERVGVVRSLKDGQETVSEAKKNRQLAMAIDGPVVGKQINENDILYTDILENDAKIIEQKYKKYLTPDQAAAFEEIKAIKRREKPFWAVGA